MARSARQIKILELIEKNEIETQDELAAQLQQAGYIVTQATISRDIKELGLVKAAAGYKKQKYIEEKNDYSLSNKITKIFKNAVISIDCAINLIVLKTLSGAASSTGMMIDHLGSKDVLGCVAGDDTVLVVCRDETAAAGVVEQLSDILKS